jgi:hypothetical protein
MERKVNKHEVDSLCVAEIARNTDRNKEKLERIDEMDNYSACKMLDQHISVCSRFLGKYRIWGLNHTPNYQSYLKTSKQTVSQKEVKILSITVYTLVCKGTHILQITSTITRYTVVLSNTTISLFINSAASFGPTNQHQVQKHGR